MKIRALPLVVLVCSAVMAASARDCFVYFGTYTGAMSKGIYVSRLNTESGELSPPELAVETPSPCYLAVSPGQKELYSADSVARFNGEKTGAVSAFAIDGDSGHLTRLNQKSSGGAGACYVDTDATGKVLLVANYGGGSVKSFRLNDDGSLGVDGSFILHHGTSVNSNRQNTPHAHFIHMDPSNRFALACDLGADKVIVYKVNLANGEMAQNSFGSVPPGSGARHLAFSQDGKYAYVVNEMGCTVTTFSWDKSAGKLTRAETVSVLPPGIKTEPSYTAAEIATAGSFVYVTIRGHDSVSVLSEDPSSGRLKFVQNISADGGFPRGMGIDPTGHWLIVGNQKTDNAVEFAIDTKTGELSATGRTLKVGSPIDVKFMECSE